jgi:hypothetical protein
MSTRISTIVAAGMTAMLAACSQGGAASGVAAVRNTGFPGQVTAGGGTSGEVIAQAKTNKPTDGSYAGGTPYIAGGSGGNTGGAATGGTVQESGHAPSGNTTPPATKPDGK